MFFRFKALQKKTVTAGTAVALVASKLVAHGVKIKALPGNTDEVFVGATGVTAANGFALAAGQEIDLAGLLPLGLKDAGTDLSTIFVNSAVDAEGVCVSYLELSQG